MNHLHILIIFLGFATVGFSQQTLDLEIRTSRNVTYNSSKIERGGLGFGGYQITREDNQRTLSYSIGMVYGTDRIGRIKLHVGKHQNGRIVDLTEYDDNFNFNFREDYDLLYNYIQFVPSYAYSVRKGKFEIPVELGFAINKRIKEEDIYLGISEYNYDIRLSGGIQYRLNRVRIGSNIVFSKSMGDYLSVYAVGEYRPYQVGVEIGVGYILKVEQADTVTNIK